MFLLLRKSVVIQHVRREASGKLTTVHEYSINGSGKHGEDVVTAPNGRDSFGMIQGEVARASGLPPLPIRLLRGAQYESHKGFGLQHIKEQHGEEIRKAGFKSESDFVADVVKNFNAIYKVGENRYALVANGNLQKVHIIELSNDKTHYSVITGYIAERKDFERKPHILKLWPKGMRKALEWAAERLQAALAKL